jgi:hypothetical protein
MDNENIFVDYDYTGGGSFENVDVEDQWNYIDAGSHNLKIGDTVNLNDYDNNGNIIHAEKSKDDHVPYHGQEGVTETYGSHIENIKFANSCTASPLTDGDLLICTSNGYTSSVDEERSMAGNVPSLNNANVSQSVVTSFNNNTNEFTFVFLSNKYGFKNNYFKIGNF